MSKITHRYSPIVFAAVFTAASALSQEGTSLESDWIELVKGHKGATLGVELRDIEDSAADGSRTVTLAVPKDAIDHPDTIEEVVVRARGPEQPQAPEPLPIKYQWLDDYDEDHYGLVIHIGENNWPIRLYLNSRSAYMHEE